MFLVEERNRDGLYRSIAISERIDCSLHLHIIMKDAYGLPFSLDTVQDQEHECKINCGTK